MKTSTNALTSRYCAEKGWVHQTVQTWSGGKRHDLFGIADTLLLLDGIVYFIQNCSYGTLKKHRDDIDANPLTPQVSRHGMIELWEWRKKKVGRKGMWFLRVQAYTSGWKVSPKGWSEVGAWEGPHDLYGKKEKKCSPAN